MDVEAFHYYGLQIPDSADIEILTKSIINYYNLECEVENFDEFEFPANIGLPFSIAYTIGNPMTPDCIGAIIFIKANITRNSTLIDPEELDKLESKLYDRIEPDILDYLSNLLEVPYGWHLALSYGVKN